LCRTSREATAASFGVRRRSLSVGMARCQSGTVAETGAESAIAVGQLIGRARGRPDAYRHHGNADRLRALQLDFPRHEHQNPICNACGGRRFSRGLLLRNQRTAVYHLRRGGCAWGVHHTIFLSMFLISNILGGVDDPSRKSRCQCRKDGNHPESGKMPMRPLKRSGLAAVMVCGLAGPAVAADHWTPDTNSCNQLPTTLVFCPTNTD
jgi:hypothetical protein